MTKTCWIADDVRPAPVAGAVVPSLAASSAGSVESEAGMAQPPSAKVLIVMHASRFMNFLRGSSITVLEAAVSRHGVFVQRWDGLTVYGAEVRMALHNGRRS